jgi:hypothetical protein
MSGRDELVAELKTLRKGRGLHANTIGQRVGPALGRTCGITEGDGMLVIREKVAARLSELADQLPEDLCMVTSAAFGIGREARMPLYQDRVRWAARRTDRDPRTVRRRVDEAIDQLAELALREPRSRVGDPADAWHTTDLNVAVAMDQAQPEVLERRRIVADRDDLRELDLAVSPAVARRDLDVTVFHGGTLRDRGMEASDRLGFTLALPKPLARGETFDFTMRFRLPTARAMRPYLVCVPRLPCDSFDLSIRFGRDLAPRHVWSMQGAFQRDVTDPRCHGAHHPVDHTGEIRMRYQHMTPGLAYGARWEPTTPGTS